METIILQSAGHDPVTLNIGVTTRSYLDHAVLLPWMSPQRALGFVHPADEEKIGKAPFTLHSSLAFYSSVGAQQVGANAFRPVEGPKMLLPWELISSLTIQVYDCPSAIFIREQDEAFKEMIHSLFVQLVDPPRIQAPAGVIDISAGRK